MPAAGQRRGVCLQVPAETPSSFVDGRDAAGRTFVYSVCIPPFHYWLNEKRRIQKNDTDAGRSHRPIRAQNRSGWFCARAGNRLANISTGASLQGDVR